MNRLDATGPVRAAVVVLVGVSGTATSATVVATTIDVPAARPMMTADGAFTETT